MMHAVEINREQCWDSGYGGFREKSML